MLRQPALKTPPVTPIIVEPSTQTALPAKNSALLAVEFTWMPHSVLNVEDPVTNRAAGRFGSKVTTQASPHLMSPVTARERTVAWFCPKTPAK